MKTKTMFSVAGLILASFLVGNAMSPVGAQSGSVYTPHPSDFVSVGELALRLSDFQPDKFQVWGSDISQPIVTIYFDGRVEFGPNMTQDEASRLFWTYVAQHPSCAERVK